MKRTALTISLILLLLGPFLHTAVYRHLDRNKPDFSMFYYSTLAWQHGLDPYAVSDRLRMLDAYPPGEEFSLCPCPYPPSFLLLMQPVTLLTYRAARIAWLLLNLGALCAALALAARLFPGRERSEAALAAVVVVALFTPLIWDIASGQINQLIILLSLAGWLWSLRRPWLAGCCLGVAIALKLVPAFFALGLLAFGRWRPVLAATAVFILLLAAGLALHPGQIPLLPSWQSTLWELTVAGDYTFWSNLSFPILLQRVHTYWLTGLPAWLFTGLAGLEKLVILGLLAFAFRRVRRAAGVQAKFYFALVTAFLLLSGYVHHHYLTWLLIPFMYHFLRAWEQDRFDRWTLLLVVAYLVTALDTDYRDVKHLHGARTLLANFPLYGVFLFYIYQLRRLLAGNGGQER